ncbi:Restriction endonuclease [Arthrobacter sp. ok909]|nr:Restriction endonuclease [Arthrobacter sp. ok909]
MGVGQQAVSGWERGMSRPRQSQLPALCSLLLLDVADATRAGEYEADVTISTHRMLTLPFENLPDDAFEAFCRDLISFRNPDRTATRNGSTGQKQYGVDVFVDGAGERIGVQCKRHKSFGPADIRAAVGEVLPEAGITSGVIALSRRTASASARLEMAKYPGWTLWDGEDLSRFVREIPVDQALILVDTYFNGLREGFLGIRLPSPWLTPNEYDSALPGRLGIERGFELVGRAESLDRLTELALNHERLVLVVGRGGIGKTRFLREFALSELGRPICFAARGPIAPETYALLPQGAPVVVIDDAMDSDFDVASLTQGVLRARPDATIVFSARPRLVSQLREQLGMAEASTNDITVELDDLTISDAEALAREALGDQATDARAESLARIGYDCPFLIVLGAHLVRSGKLSDSDLQSQGQLRREILTRFADIVVRGSSADARTAVLGAVAAVQPAPLDEYGVVDGLAAVSGQEPDRVLEIIEELEDLGLILRRKHTVRVVPDLLGDAILERALVSDSGIEKRFAKRLADHATGRALTHAIKNVSIIDWHRRSEGPSQLADVLWSTLNQHALALSNSKRTELSKRIAPVAVIYPEQALDLVESLLGNPAPDEEDPFSGIWGKPRQITNDDLARSLAPLVANAGHSTDHLERSMRLLFSIGRTDERQEHQNPDHALRLLRELGEFHPNRSVRFNERFVEVIGKMLKEDRHATDRALLIAMLKPALASDLTVTEWKSAASLSMRHLTINLETVAGVRMRAIALASDCLTTNDIESALAAIDVLEESLRSHDRADDVTHEFAQVAETLRRLISDEARPAGIRLAAYRALGWHATYGEGERRRLARQIRKQLVQDDDFLLARILRPGWDIDEDEDEGDLDDDSNFASRYQRSAEAIDLAIQGLVSRWTARGESKALLGHVRTAMNEEKRATGRFSSPDLLLRRLFAAEPEVARDVLGDHGKQDPVEDALTRAALSSLLELEGTSAAAAAARLIAASPTHAALVASAVVDQGAPLNGLRENIVRKLVQTDFPEVHLLLLSAARWLGAEERGIVLEMLQAAPIESDAQVADAAAGVLAGGSVVPWASLMPDERKAILDRLAASPTLRPDNLGRLLNAEIKIDPISALRFLQKRIDRGGRPRDGFDPPPHVPSLHINFQSSPQLTELIDATVEWILEKDSWERRFYGKQLLEPMLSGYRDEAKALLRRLITSRDEQRVNLANSLLDGAPHNFVIRETQFVEELLEEAHQMPESLGRHVIAGLHGSAEFGMRSRSVGVDDPEEVALRDEATATAQRYPEGSPIRLFYEDVAQYASHRLHAERLDDRSLEDPRTW